MVSKIKVIQILHNNYLWYLCGSSLINYQFILTDKSKNVKQVTAAATDPLLPQGT